MQGITIVNNKLISTVKITLVSKFVISALQYNYCRIKETKDTIFQKTVRTSKQLADTTVKEIRSFLTQDI
jgi:adenine specific DNA methylase Mod